ncbi:MAG: ATP synthase F1 subunit delta [Candidatus Moranbacteria bacterium RBG_19FT_COMBO_42_6]|nr:MAG: ATP synthase F1 subunit delta [Candidatus Moranbacteria bacterium RBG_19FT_COMBO_42_6]
MIQDLIRFRIKSGMTKLFMKITTTQYARTLHEAVKDKSQEEISGIISGFVKILAKNNQIKNGGKIIAKFGDIYNKENGIVEAEVVTKHKLESSQVHKVESYIKERYSTKKVILKNTVDEKIKGGIVIKVGDELIDGSVLTQLEKLKSSLEK